MTARKRPFIDLSGAAFRTVFAGENPWNKVPPLAHVRAKLERKLAAEDQPKPAAQKPTRTARDGSKGIAA